MQRRKLRWETIAGSAALVALALLAILRANQGEQPQLSAPSTFEYGPGGYAALYDLLQREGVNVGRFERPHALLSHVRGTLVLAQTPTELIVGHGGLGRNDLTALRDWVRAGGRLIALSPPYGDAGDTLLGIPASRKSEVPASHAVPFARLPANARVHRVSGDFSVEFDDRAAPKALPLLVSGSGIVALEYRFGAGTVIAFTDPSIFSNARLIQDDNARFAYNLLAPGEKIVFDEAVHGYTTGNSLWSALPIPVHYALYLAVAALLFAVIGNLVRFEPPLQLPAADEPDSSAYLTAMASLLERAGASRRVLGDRVDFTLRALRRTLGVSDRAPLRALVARITRPETRAQVAELERLLRLERPTDAELMRAGTLCVRLQKEVGA